MTIAQVSNESPSLLSMFLRPILRTWGFFFVGCIVSVIELVQTDILHVTNSSMRAYIESFFSLPSIFLIYCLALSAASFYCGVSDSLRPRVLRILEPAANLLDGVIGATSSFLVGTGIVAAFSVVLPRHGAAVPYAALSMLFAAWLLLMSFHVRLIATIPAHGVVKRRWVFLVLGTLFLVAPFVVATR